MLNCPILITDLGSSGEGVGTHEGLKVFVPGALPGETVRVRLKVLKSNYAIADLVEIIKDSPARVIPICPLFGRCGGCQIMHLDYEAQLKLKEERVRQTFKRIGHLDVDVQPCVPSPNPLHYRNKIQLPMAYEEGRRFLGLYAHGTHEVIPVDKCFIHCPQGEAVYERIKEWLPGDIRYLLIRTAFHPEGVLVTFVTKEKQVPWLASLAEKIMQELPIVKGVVQNVNPHPHNVILGSQFNVIRGSGMLTEEVNGLRFLLSSASFFQVNTAQAEALYQMALKYADIQPSERVLDAYCGVGTLALQAARFAKEVVGIECVPAAIDDAKKNALLNKISNATFYLGKTEEWIARQAAFDKVILNPPRKGCEKEVIHSLIKKAPKKIIYISCDPATLARDCRLLTQAGFAIKDVQPFDMFPQTMHVETAVHLIRL